MTVDKKIIRTIKVICLLFFLLILYLTYFEFFEKDRILTSSYNQRLNAEEANVLRGNILDRNGEVLAKSQIKGGTQERIYPYGSLYSHIIGYDSKVYGKSLLEAKFNKYLSNSYDAHAIMDITAKIGGQEPAGANMTLTLDHDLQTRAEKLMRNLKGAVVVMDPRTGEILAMVSKPDFNPNNSKLDAKWNTLIESSDAPFMPRATQGLYPPGSTFKVVISAAALDNNLSDMTLTDKGSVTIDGKEFRNAGGKAYGDLDLKKALAVSSNTYFSTLGKNLGFDRLKSAALAFGLEKGIPFDLPLSQSSFPYKDMSQTDMASVGIGQGKILVTPLQMAMITSGIANDGVIMKPLLVKKVQTVSGITLLEERPSQLYKAISPETAAAVRDMMIGVVQGGTGKNAALKGVQVAGKTGTAQNESTKDGKGKEHAWFIGFAPADNPVVAVAVVAEYSGKSGGELCAPIARKLMSAWLEAQGK
ncbi:MAG: penicillin-binding transpeptidase domain-containing protein [Clostridia bacterium]|nr:penicillin-binding transpeptidase domain-containing protein [Clostridia bacterium]